MYKILCCTATMLLAVAPTAADCPDLQLTCPMGESIAVGTCLGGLLQCDFCRPLMDSLRTKCRSPEVYPCADPDCPAREWFSIADDPRARKVLGQDWDWFNASSWGALQILELCYASGRPKAMCDAEFDTNRHNMCRMEGLVSRTLQFGVAGACDIAAEAQAKLLNSKDQKERYRKLNDWFVAHSSPRGGPGGNEGSRSTPWGDDGRGNAVYLDRHDVKCATGEALTRFRLRRNPAHTLYRYEYSCLQTGLEACRERSTPLNDDGKGNAVYLDRHEVKCGEREALAGFRLARNSEHTRYEFRYECCAASLSSCRDLDTGWNDEGGGSAVYLDRHDIRCDDGEVLTSFRLRRNPGQAKYRYEYTCCSTAGGSVDRPDPTPNDGSAAPYVAGADGVTVPVLVRSSQPSAPALALEARIHGNVILQVVVRKDGSVGDAKVLRSQNPMFDSAAIEAVRQWRYEPATKDGQPVDVYLKVEVDFPVPDAPPAATGYACYWLNGSTNTWQPMSQYSTKRQCFEMDGCDGGLGRSGGGCYKWATGPQAPREPWD